MRALTGQVQVELALFLRDKTVVFFSLFFPLVTVAHFGYLNRGAQVPVLGAVNRGGFSYASFLIVGGIGMVVSSAAFENLSTALARQRDAGILKRSSTRDPYPPHCPSCQRNTQHATRDYASRHYALTIPHHLRPVLFPLRHRRRF